MADRKFNITVSNYTVSKIVDIEKDCSAWTATNIGDTTVQVNGIILFPSVTPLTVLGDGVSIGGNKDEIYFGRLNVSFIQPIGAAPQVQIIQKFYIK